MSRRVYPILLATVLIARIGTARANEPVPVTSARAAVLMEGRTGQVIWAKNPHARLAPASTTKIMTALLAAETLPLTRVVTVSPHASKADGSSIWLEPGERRTVSQLIYGAMLNSGNDACVALAEAVAGSEARFALMMTARARSLGALDTSFVNADGLPAAGHVSSAFDLAVMAKAAMANPTFSRIVRTKVYDIPWPGKDWDRRLINHNKLLWRYEGADGVKTGYTVESGHCLVASATRGGRQLIAVVLDSPRMYEECSVMLDYGFSEFALVDPGARATKFVPLKGGEESSVDVRPGRVLAFCVPSGQARSVRLVMDCPRRLAAPVAKGQKVGWAMLVGRGSTLTRVPLVAVATVARRGLLASIAAFIRRYFGKAASSRTSRADRITWQESPAR